MKKLTLSKAKKKAVYAFQKWVRNREKIGNLNTCVTCGRMYPVEGKGCIQAGHFIAGRGNAILFDERGCWPQCYICNVVKKGNMIKYYKWMLERYGQAVINKLEILDTTTVKYTVQDYLDIEAKYLKLLEKS